MSRAMDRLLIVGASERWPQGSPTDEVAACVESLVSGGGGSYIRPLCGDLGLRATMTVAHRRPVQESASGAARKESA